MIVLVRPATLVARKSNFLFFFLFFLGWFQPYKTTLFAFLVVVGYIFVGTLSFCLIEHWTILDGVYFCVVVLTTVGYGGLVVQTVGGKVFVIFYVLTGFSLILFALGLVGDYLLDKQQKAMIKLIDGDEDDAKKKKSFFHIPARIWAAIITIMVIFGLGTGIYYRLEPEWGAFNAFYFTVVTSSTVGERHY
jgi:hypothetical protein